jgi:uncharacterized protein YndB with AHSA1/START domain
MARVEGEVVIRRPVDEVFDFVADERNEPRYNPRVRDVELITDEPVGKGSMFSAKLETPRRRLPMTIEFTEFDRPRRLASSTHSSLMDTEGALTFEPVADGTRMRWLWEVRPRGALHLVGSVVGVIGRRQERTIWGNLKRLLEAGGAEAREPVPGARRVQPVRDALRLAGVMLTATLSGRRVRPVDDERVRSLRGDELVRDAKLGWTYAISIHARPADVWPWLVQMGCRRAGWYSYDGLDNGGVPSADRILPQLQHVQVGDVFPQTPKAEDRFVVRAVEPGRALVLGDDVGSMSWAFVLEPLDGPHTRLITRSRGTYDRLALGLMLQAFWRPVHFGMQRRQLLNLERLVETTAHSVVVLVVGIPGAGKTVLIDRAANSEWTVLDNDRLRRRLPTALRRMPVLYPFYVLVLVAAIARHPRVVAESRGTYAWLRRLVTACARARGREAVIVLLDASTEDALAGQKLRGRVAPAPVMQANTTSWGRLLDAARSGALAAKEGWSKVVVLDRADASEVDDLGELIRAATTVRRTGNGRG